MLSRRRSPAGSVDEQQIRRCVLLFLASRRHFLSTRCCGNLFLASRRYSSVFVPLDGYSYLIDTIPRYSSLWAAILSWSVLFLGVCHCRQLFLASRRHSLVFVAVGGDSQLIGAIPWYSSLRAIIFRPIRPIPGYSSLGAAIPN